MAARMLLLLALGLQSLLQLSSAVVLNHRVLLMTLDSPTTYTDFAEDAVKGYGVPYDILKLSTANAGTFNYTNYLRTTGAGNTVVGKYSAVFMYPPLYDFQVGGVSSGLNATQQMQLKTYLTAFNVRMVIFGLYPPGLGVSGLPEHAITLAPPTGGTGNDMKATFAVPALQAAKADAGTGINFAGVAAMGGLSTAGLYKNPVAVAGLGSAHSAIMTFAADATYASATVAAVISSLPDGAGKNYSQMSFFFDCASFNPTCLLLNHLWVNWQFRALVPGERVTMLNTHVDDLLLTTEDIRGVGYRINSADLTGHIDWTNGLNSRLPKGSKFQMEIVINGNGALEQSMPDIASDIPDPVSASGNDSWPKDFKKPVGTGTDQVKDASNTPNSALWTTGLDPTKWNLATIKAGDTLSRAINTNAAVRNGFFWGHHTWSHQEMDNATKHDSVVQIKYNIEMLGPSYLNMTTLPTFSNTAMVTPSISGLLNADFINTLVSYGIKAAMGDNTYPDLLTNQANRWLLKYTDVPTFGTSGFAIMPREATEVYYLVSLVRDEESVYNGLYLSYFGALSTWPQILEREATRVVGNLLRIRHDPHMFHQANMRTNFTGAGDKGYGFVFNANPVKRYSLLQAWVEQVMYRYMQLVNWPVISMKMDDLFRKYKERAAQENCKLEYQFTTAANGAVSQVTISSKAPVGSGSCKAPLTAAVAGTGAGVTSTTAGSLYPISYCTFGAGTSCTVTLPTPVSWTS